MVEGARLESVYTPKGYRGFESLSLREKSSQFAVFQLIAIFLLHFSPPLVHRLGKSGNKRMKNQMKWVKIGREIVGLKYGRGSKTRILNFKTSAI